MKKITQQDFIVDPDERVLITGANGFIGSRLVSTLIQYGFKKLRCFVRPSSDLTSLRGILESSQCNRVELIRGNLLSHDDCIQAAEGISVIYHLAAGTGGKSFPAAYLNSVVTTRNLLDAAATSRTLKRFVNVSSLAVYSNMVPKWKGKLDETCEIEKVPHLRNEAYCYAKVRQDELVIDYGGAYGIPYVIVRPGVVYGPGRKELSDRIGIGTFGIFLHLGGANRIPLTYVDNCAEAIALAGLKRGVDGEAFNVIDDEAPTSRQFLKMYKKNVRNFKSIYVPKKVSYFLCCLWEKFSEWSAGQLPPLFNRKRWHVYWRGGQYSNEKIKKLLGWEPIIPFDEASSRYFEYYKEGREYR